MAVIAKIQSALGQGRGALQRKGRRLTTVSAVVDAWMHGGLVAEEPEQAELITAWTRSKA